MPISNFEYRNYMTKNGRSIIDNNRSEALIAGGFLTRDNKQISSNVPYLYGGPEKTPMIPGYTASDLKTSYINSVQRDLFIDGFKITKK